MPKKLSIFRANNDPVIRIVRQNAHLCPLVTDELVDTILSHVRPKLFTAPPLVSVAFDLSMCELVQALVMHTIQIARGQTVDRPRKRGDSARNEEQALKPIVCHKQPIPQAGPCLHHSIAGLEFNEV
jgi:hypothetical protein